LRWKHTVIHLATNQIKDTAALRDEQTEQEIEGLSVDQTPAITGLTDFANEAIVSTIVDSGKPGATNLIVDDEYQDVKRFFERPRLITSFSASTSRGVNYVSDVSNPVTQYWPAVAANRLNGVLGYNCTIKYTVTVAATPFQQTVVVPNFQYNTWDGANSTHPRSNYPALVTNLPHVRLDIADATMAELVVPFTAASNYFDLANTIAGGGDNYIRTYGRFAVTTILPYAALTVAAPTFRVYVSLHDMNLFGAVPVTLNAVLPQAGLADAAEKETKRLVKKAGTVVRTTMGIPKVSGVIRNAAWLAGKVAGVAEAFGFSKPIDELPMKRRWHTGYTYDTHVDQPSEAFTMAPYQSNRLVFDSKVTNSEVDEMAFKFVLGKYAQTFVGDMATSDVGGTVLYAANVSPTSFWFKSNTGRPGGNTAMPTSATLTTNCFAPTALCYLAQMFRYWTGSIKFRFSFCKTKFHAGRVLASFIPATYDTLNTFVLSNPVPVPEIAGGLVQPFQYSTIFDLKDGNSFEIEVPYISSRPWISVLGSSGGLSLTVVDPLIASGETSSSITYLVEVCAGDSFDLGSFTGNGLFPFVGLNPIGSLAALQSGLDVAPNEDVTQYTMGEKFSSIKELIQIPHTSKKDMAAGSNANWIFPHWTVAPRFTHSIPMAPTTTAWYAKSHLVALSRMYTFVSGGTNFNLYSERGFLGFLGQAGQTWRDNDTGTVAFQDPRFKTLGPIPKVIIDNTGVAHLKQPSYQRSLRAPIEGMVNEDVVNWEFGNSNFKYINSSTITTATLFNLVNRNAQVNAINIGISASDDSTLYNYIGPPMCMLGTSLQSVDIEKSNASFYF
jgi:hypothetical protein